MLPIGGPGPALSAKRQGEILFEVLGKKPFYLQVPVALFDVINGGLAALARLFPGLADTAEFGRIGQYYAVESMLVLDGATGRYDADATPEYGTETLRDFYARVARDGMAGQELGDAALWGQK